MKLKNYMLVSPPSYSHRNLLKSMKNNILLMTNLLIHQKIHHICPLIPTQLNDFPIILIFLEGTIAWKILLEGFANSLHVQIIRETSDSGDTFSAVSLLDSDVDFVSLISGLVIFGIFKGVCVVKIERVARNGCWESSNSRLGRDDCLTDKPWAFGSRHVTCSLNHRVMATFGIQGGLKPMRTRVNPTPQLAESKDTASHPFDQRSIALLPFLFYPCDASKNLTYRIDQIVMTWYSMLYFVFTFFESPKCY